MPERYLDAQAHRVLLWQGACCSGGTNAKRLSSSSNKLSHQAQKRRRLPELSSSLVILSLHAEKGTGNARLFLSTCLRHNPNKTQNVCVHIHYCQLHDGRRCNQMNRYPRPAKGGRAA